MSPGGRLSRRVRTGRWGLGVVVTTVLLVSLASACGVPTDGEPRAITAESTTTNPPPPSAGPAAGMATIYLSRPTSAAPEQDAELVAVTRNLGEPPTPPTVLEALFEGATEEEQDRSLVSLIPADTALLGWGLEPNGRLTVELNEEWSTLLGPDQLGAYAQVVLSVTDLPEVRAVRFRVDGEPIDEVPTEGDPRAEVTGGDYRGLDPS